MAEWEDEWEEADAEEEEAPAAADDDGASHDWRWERIERDLARLPVAARLAGDAIVDEDDKGEDAEKLAQVLRLAEAAAEAVDAARGQLAALSALALVAKAQLLAAQAAFPVELQGGGGGDADASAVLEQLRASAGRWGESEPSEREARAARQKLQEMSAVLQRALAASAGDLSPFQQVLEQVFASLPQHTLAVSVMWIRDSVAPSAAQVEASASSREARYLQHLQEIADPAAAPEQAVAELSEAEVFQDAKDIKRDELVINGESVPGTVGYAAIVDKLQRQIHETLRAHVGQQSPSGYQADAYADTTRAIAKQILNACNRTESGGSSYEVLSKFLSSHATDVILIRPDSAKAAPLEIHLDVGAFVETSRTSGDEMWAFGVRALLSAATWYLVCDSDDPTSELYDVKATYENRMAFPLGLTPFHPLHSMRRDNGTVKLQVMLPHASTSPLTSLTARKPGSVELHDADLHELL